MPIELTQEVPAPTHDFKFGTPVNELFRDPAGYDPDPDLEAAVRVALLLGMPMLLTGEPGCGKTSLAYWLAWRLNLGKPLVHNVKSTSTGRDLLYEFDELARFRDSQAQEKQPTQHYLRLNALGRAIVLSARPDTVLIDSDLTHAQLAKAGMHGSVAEFPFATRHVVLVDELDKAPRDTPNDLLFEIEQMRFRVNEMRASVNGDPDKRPVVIITSNSEKSLPEPFLRRCVFHHIKPPDKTRRREIIARRKHSFAARGLLFEEAMRFFESLHTSLGRSPGTAELLNWLTALEQQVVVAQARQGQAPASLKGLVAPTLGTLAKTKEDLDRATGAMNSAKLA